MEFLYSPEVQNLWLKGGARPVLEASMVANGEIDEALYAALPEAPADTVVPSAAQSTAAAALLGSAWATAVQ
jgi:putative spermidine/putrescine transport system substrate-binding protein